MTRTTIQVDGARVRLRHGLLRGQQVAAPAGRVRIGLLGTQALLLGGDVVELDVELGAGSQLDLFDVAGTVAYDGRGRSASWLVSLRVGAGARLSWAGQPFVVADGAEVDRRLTLDLAEGAAASIRETLRLGRSGETGGRLRNRLHARRCGTDLLLEDQTFDAAELRTLPGLLGPHQVVDSLLTVGEPAPDLPGATAYALPAGAGTLQRWLGRDAAASPLAGL